MINISPHITYEEATHSDVAKRLGILNEPDGHQLLCMKDIATRIFEPLRANFCIPIYVSSFFRSSALNKAIKGAKGSQHLLGQAMDLDADMFGIITNKQIFDYIKDNLIYDQLIAEGLVEGSLEPRWVHCSYDSKLNRGEILICEIVNNKPKYYTFKNEKGLDIRSYR
jgi:hypothetical protein